MVVLLRAEVVPPVGIIQAVDGLEEVHLLLITILSGEVLVPGAALLQWEAPALMVVEVARAVEEPRAVEHPGVEAEEGIKSKISFSK